MPFATATVPSPPKAPLTARGLPRRIVAGREALADVAKPLKLWKVYSEADRAPTDTQAHRVLVELVAAHREKMKLLTEGLESGRLGLPIWYRGMKDQVTALHVAAHMSTTGETQVPNAERPALLATLNRELAYLDRFRVELRTGEQLLGPGATHRAGLYADSAYVTGMGGLDARKRAEGHTTYKSILGSSDHCTGCLDRAAMGWQPIGSLLPIGQAECGPRCRCRWIYRKPVKLEVEATPEPGLPAYGPSKARVRLDPEREDLTVEAVEAELAAIAGRPLPLTDLASLVGAPDGALVTVERAESGVITLAVRGNGWDAYRHLSRAVQDGLPTIENESFVIDSEHQGKGLGAEVFGRQVEQASRLGFARIITEAARGKGLIGYHVWPRFGYDGLLPYSVQARVDAGLLALPYPAERLSDLMRTSEGRGWWKEHGQNVELEFDLTDGSLSRQVWDGYRREKTTATASRSAR